MEINCNNTYIKIDWQSIVGACISISSFILLNALSKRGQLKSVNINLHNKSLSLNS